MEYICKHCNKVYKSSHSRSNHYRIYHKDIVPENVSIIKDTVTTKVSIVTKPQKKTHNCLFCNKNFKTRQNKWEHQTKHCKNRDNDTKDDNNKTIEF